MVAAVILFIVLGMAALVGAVTLIRQGDRVILEIEALMLVLIAAVFLVGAGIVEAIVLATERLSRRRDT
jgi:hypothetical protein